MDNFETEKNQINILDDEVIISGTLAFRSQVMRVISAIILTKDITEEDFRVVGSGFASGRIEEYNDLLKKLGLPVFVND